MKITVISANKSKPNLLSQSVTSRRVGNLLSALFNSFNRRLFPIRFNFFQIFRISIN